MVIFQRLKKINTLYGFFFHAFTKVFVFKFVKYINKCIITLKIHKGHKKSSAIWDESIN